jgi:protein TonB
MIPVKIGTVEKQSPSEAAPSKAGPVVVDEPLGNDDPEPQIVAPGDGVKPSGGFATPVVTEADTIRRVTPVYPLASRRRGEEGEVRLLVGVARDGSSVSVEIASTSGFFALDEAAIFAVRRWRFAPGSPEKLIVPVIFRLE